MNFGTDLSNIAWNNHTVSSDIIGALIEIVVCGPTVRRILYMDEIFDIQAFEDDSFWHVRIMGLYKNFKITFSVDYVSVEIASAIVLQMQRLQNQMHAVH